PPDFDRYAESTAPDCEIVSHQTFFQGSFRGREFVLRNMRALVELSHDISKRVEDVLALERGALLVRWVSFGSLRDGGGAYERPMLVLWVFGPEGRIARWEQFDVGHEGEALARFDELVTGRDPEVTRRHVRPNAATANGTRLAAALNARDADAVAATLAEGVETIDHTTGAVLDRQGMLYTY